METVGRRAPPLSGSIDKEGTHAIKKQRCSGAAALLKLILRLCDVPSSASPEDSGESAQVSGDDRWEALHLCNNKDEWSPTC